MSIKREQVGEIDFTLLVYRNGQKLQNSEGSYDLKEFVRGFEIFESIENATIEASFIFEDAAGLIGALTGSEQFALNIVGTIVDKSYSFRSYEIESRTRTNQGSDVFIVNCASDEFVRNEVTNVFGNSEVIFKNGTEASQIVKQLVKNQKYLSSGKKVYLEETLNDHHFVAPNWRPFDAIYWIAQRTIRKSQSGGGFQNGFAFFENGLGFNFKSVDKMIEDINDQSPTEKTNTNTGKPRLYSYSYSPKRGDDGTMDSYKINALTFPSERNFLDGLRHGAWSGFSIGFDPNTVPNSKMGTSTDMSVDAYRYSLKELWSNMSHLGKNSTNPFEKADDNVKNLVDYPKRVRYTILPNQIFDPKFQQNADTNYEALVELQAYQWMRFESLKTIKLKIKIPGNLDLYAGHGINIVIPATTRSGSKTQIDKKYSGRYMIASLTHSSTGTILETELFLVKDSVLK